MLMRMLCCLLGGLYFHYMEVPQVAGPQTAAFQGLGFETSSAKGSSGLRYDTLARHLVHTETGFVTSSPEECPNFILSPDEGNRTSFQKFTVFGVLYSPPLWSSGQSSWLQNQRFRVRFPALPDFLRSIGSGTGSTQPREDN
jgi:hypothetical protein